MLIQHFTFPMCEMFSSSSWTILCNVYGSSSEAQLYLKLLTSTPPPVSQPLNVSFRNLKLLIYSLRFVSQPLKISLQDDVSLTIVRPFAEEDGWWAALHRSGLLRSHCSLVHDLVTATTGPKSTRPPFCVCVTPYGPWEQFWTVHYIFFWNKQKCSGCKR